MRLNSLQGSFSSIWLFGPTFHVFHSLLIWVDFWFLQVSRKHLFAQRADKPSKTGSCGWFLQERSPGVSCQFTGVFTLIYHGHCLIFSHKFYQCFPFHQKCFLSLLIYDGSLAYQIFSKKGWAFPLMNLNPHFLPVPTLSSNDPSFFFPCPNPTAKKNQLHQRGWLPQPDKDDTAPEGNLGGKPWSLIALHRELNSIKIKCTLPKERLLWDPITPQGLKPVLKLVRSLAWKCHNLEVHWATAICSC